MNVPLPDAPSDEREPPVIIQPDSIWKRFGSFVKFYKIPIICYVGISVGLIILFFTDALHFNEAMGWESYRNDYQTYYWAGKAFYQNPPLIYDIDYLMATYGAYPYRYFPAFLLLMYPLLLLPELYSFLTYSALSIIVSIVNIFLVQESIRLVNHGKSNGKFEWLCKLYFFMPFVYSTMLLGQNANFVAFALVFSLYNFLKRREALGGLFLGFSIVLKPAAFFQIFFVILALARVKDLKLLLKRLFLILIPLIPDILLFLFVRNLFSGFMAVDFGEFQRTGGIPAFVLSVSLSNFLIVLFSANSSTVMLVLIVISLAGGLFILAKLKDQQEKLLFSFIYGAAIYFVVQTDVWESQYAYLHLFLIILGTLGTFRKNKLFLAMYLLYDWINLLPPICWVTIDPSKLASLYVYYAGCGIITVIFVMYVVQYFWSHHKQSQSIPSR